MALRDEPVRYDLRQLLQVVLATVFLRPTLRFAYRCRVRFAAELPPGPFILASNHRSFLDPPFVGMWLDRPICYFARANLWKIPGVGFMLRTFGGLPIERDMPQMAIMRRTVEWLRSGERILVFPEGTRTRNGQLGKLREGAALFSRRAGVPVVPVYVHATDRVWPRGWPCWVFGNARAEIRYGKPIVAPKSLNPRLRDRVVTEYLRRWMARQELELRGRR